MNTNLTHDNRYFIFNQSNAKGPPVGVRKLSAKVQDGLPSTLNNSSNSEKFLFYYYADFWLGFYKFL